MGLLLLGGGFVGRASPQTTPLQRIIKLRQRGVPHVWSAQCHSGARRRVYHPGRHHREDAWQVLYMEKLSRPAPVEKRLPA